MTIDLDFNFGTDVAALTPRYKLMASNGTLGSAVNPLTAGYLINSATGSYFVPQVNVGSSRGVLWYCDTAALAGFVSFYGSSALDAGNGAYVITVHVTDGASALQSATVRLTNGISTWVLSTDVSGNASFSLDALTYTVSVTKAGYTFTPTTRTVTGSQSGTLVNDLVMSVTVIPSPPSNPAKGTVYGSVITGDGSTLAGYIATARLVDESGALGQYRVDSVLVPTLVTDTSDVLGAWSLELFGNADITPAGTRWQITVTNSGATITYFSQLVTVVSGASTNADDLIT